MVKVQVDFKSQLRRQLGFIERSAQMFDEGHTDEAIRIAVSIRVLFHNTKSSTSLLSHLDSNEIQLASSYRKYKCGNTSYSWFGMGQVREVDGIDKYIPYEWPLNPPILLTASEWWNQEVGQVGVGKRHSRSSVVLSATNQDGGAHVDAKLNPMYAALKKFGSLGVNMEINAKGKVISRNMIEDSHLTYLRQMAFELLYSTELTNLAK